MAGYPLIDIYCHIFPERFFEEMVRVAPNLTNIGQRLRNVKKLFDLDLRFREMDEYGDYRQVISLPNPPIEDLAQGAAGLELARLWIDRGQTQRAHDLIRPIYGRFTEGRATPDLVLARRIFEQTSVQPDASLRDDKAQGLRA